MKNLLSIALFAILFTSLATAQTSVNVGATVVETIGISKEADVEFGNLTTSTTATITPGSETAGQTTGLIAIDATPSSFITVTFGATSSIITGGGGANETMTFTADVEGSQTDAGSGSDLTSGSAVQVAASDDGDGNTYHVYVGGSITSSASQVAGVYAGTYNVTIAYQ